ncbi:GerAB/ArcD/ProY family transporter [[Eubacterium] rectale]|uniref:GerAB/ArcD/ProY family transporter n=1 Tax=Agathobacter rectalis TaxID=39491 RepID=UPI00156DC0E9|nr:GerAB/ArcD/ProY family transporter [Agathobacter rectalis]NSI72000.1 GerAB/ArcD/ProY family transporter [Agathobacter rectalis]NSI77264.1 GerAB/ArcD/ProY family transporter [Agathobacter rectalis]NSI92365.1 GerAB/ArcD/ProY family transporter [Agathobacter rectalis]NSJ07445.1 GerAB/ArcD/ProY family transporter [Agathobacter rectalis]
MTKNMSTSYTFAQNESISPRQLYRLYVFNLLGVGTLVLPNNLAKLGKYAFISIALGVFMAWLFMWIVSEVRERRKTIYDRSIDKTKYAKMLIYDLIIAIYELSQAAFLAWIFVKLIRDSLIPDESFTVVLLVIMAVCAYALSGGVECRARVYEVVFFFVLIPLAAMLLFAISDVRLDYLMIKDRVGVDFSIADIFAGAYYVFAASISVFNILFVRERTASQIRGSVSKAIFTYAGILFLLYAVLLGNFGKYSLSEIEFPAVVLMSDVQIKGSFFKRADALMLSVWFFTLFSVLNMSLYYAVLRCENFAENTGKIIFTFNKNRHSCSNKQFSSDKQKSHDKEKSTMRSWCIIFVIAVTLTLAYILESGDEIVKKYLGFLLCIAIPVIVVLTIGLMLTGCSAVELEERCFPTLAAVDIVDVVSHRDVSANENSGYIEFYYNMDKSYEPEYADDIKTAVDSFEDRLSQKADTNHLKVILIGKTLRKDKAAYSDFMEYCKTSKKFPRNTYVCIADDINDIFDNMGDYYEQKINKENHEDGEPIITLGTLLDDYTNEIHETR